MRSAVKYPRLVSLCLAVAAFSLLAAVGSFVLLAPHEAMGAGSPPERAAVNTASDPRYYDMGNPTVTDPFVSPAGDNANSGATPGTPLRTLPEAWSRLPVTMTTSGYRINLLPGSYPCGDDELVDCNNFFGDRYGTYEYPVIIRAISGTATIRGGLNIANVRYLYLLDLTLVGGTTLPVSSSGNNLLHVDHADYVLLRGLNAAGPNCDNDGCNNLQEVLKVNQGQYLYVEDSTIGSARSASAPPGAYLPHQPEERPHLQQRRRLPRRPT